MDVVLSQNLAQLAPWRGTAGELAMMAMPSPAKLDDWKSRYNEGRDRVKAAQADLGRLEPEVRRMPAPLIEAARPGDSSPCHRRNQLAPACAAFWCSSGSLASASIAMSAAISRAALTSAMSRSPRRVRPAASAREISARIEGRYVLSISFTSSSNPSGAEEAIASANVMMLKGRQGAPSSRGSSNVCVHFSVSPSALQLPCECVNRARFRPWRAGLKRNVAMDRSTS